MEAKDGSLSPRGLGSSIPVESVQELAVTSGGATPQRYIRPEIDDDPLLTNDDSEDIPIIDLAKLLDPETGHAEAEKLALACLDWGFFQLINHGVSEDLIDRVKVDLMEFFKLPLEEKMKLGQQPNDIEGYGQAFVVSEDQKLDWADLFFIQTHPPSSRRMSFWPTHPSSFRDTYDNYSQELKRVADCLVGFIAKNLGVEDKLAIMFKEGTQWMRMNYYPPCRDANKVLGLSSHSDAVGLTLLLQVNDVQGLQIRRKGGWLSIKPLPMAFIVNIGDVIEILSNGRYKSIEHRAIVNTNKERLSIAGFHTLSFGDVVGPMAELVNGGEEHYKSLLFENYIRQVFSCKLEGKTILDHMRLEK